jgi:hypothetical protein
MIAIHVRRGDYLLPQHDHFCKLNIDYYSEALQHYISNIEKYHFVIFSNDIELSLFVASIATTQVL